MAEVREYAADQIVVNLDGIDLQGFDEGDFLTCVRNKDLWTVKVGQDGHATRVRSLDRSGMVTINLLGSSTANDALQAILLRDDPTDRGAVAGGAVPILIKDLNGNSLITSEKIWIKKVPDFKRGADAPGNVWVLETHELLMVHGSSLI